MYQYVHGRMNGTILSLNLSTGHYIEDIINVNQKRRGTDPCGTPDTISSVEDWVPFAAMYSSQ